VHKLLIVAITAATFTSQPISAATSVTTRSTGSLAYDATTATMMATHNFGFARLANTAPPGLTSRSAVATLKVSFAAPLERTDHVQDTVWTGSGYRQVASFVRGTAVDFEYVVDSLPDSNGNRTNLLTIKSQPGFNVPFFALDQLTYYYDSSGNKREGLVTLFNPYWFPDFDLAIYTPLHTAITVTSDVDDYVQSIYNQPMIFRLFGSGTGYDLWNVTAPGVSTVNSFSVNSSAEWIAAVPEPTSWAMMIGGFGLIGTSLRRQRRMAHA
jgi:hypothetical protein